jgi:hypothetical protein
VHQGGPTLNPNPTRGAQAQIQVGAQAQHGSCIQAAKYNSNKFCIITTDLGKKAFRAKKILQIRSLPHPFASLAFQPAHRSMTRASLVFLSGNMKKKRCHE